MFKQITLWELLIGIVITGVVTSVGYKIGTYTVVADTEFFSNSIEKLIYNEDWETWQNQTCTEEYKCNCRDVPTYSTNSEGERYQSGTKEECDTCTKTYDCSYCDEHPSYYEVVLNDGKTRRISDTYGREIAHKWKPSEHFVDKNRTIWKWAGCGKDGDVYYYSWDGSEQAAYAYCSEHRYENRIQASENLYRDHRQVNKDIALNYPAVLKDGKQSHLVGYNSPKTEQFLQYVNGKHGKNRQIKFFVYVWPDTVSYDVVENQKAYWLRCNKNEFILCLFADTEGNITKIDFITWSEGNYVPILSFKGSVDEVVRLTWGYLNENWVRLEFEKFKFLSVRPSNTCFLLTLCTNICILSIVMWFFFYNLYEKNIYGSSKNS